MADFWIRPMMDRLGADRTTALDWQQQTAELLVNSWNRIFTDSTKPVSRGSSYVDGVLMAANAVDACQVDPDLGDTDLGLALRRGLNEARAEIMKLIAA